jgi:hypothetical protein
MRPIARVTKIPIVLGTSVVSRGEGRRVSNITAGSARELNEEYFKYILVSKGNAVGTRCDSASPSRNF